MILVIIFDVANDVIGKILNFEVEIMKNELEKKESEIFSYKLNEKSKSTIEKYQKDIKNFILWNEENEILHSLLDFLFTH